VSSKLALLSEELYDCKVLKPVLGMFGICCKIEPHSNTEEDTHGNSYNRLLKGKQIILQLHGWDVDDHPNMTTKKNTPVGHGVVLWFEIDDFDEAVSRAEEIGAKFLEKPSTNPFAGHREFWLEDLDGYVVGIASQPDS